MAKRTALLADEIPYPYSRFRFRIAPSFFILRRDNSDDFHHDDG
jgi:hypothetical protein